MQDWKMTDEVARVEIDGLENNGLEKAGLEIDGLQIQLTRPAVSPHDVHSPLLLRGTINFRCIYRHAC